MYEFEIDTAKTGLLAPPDKPGVFAMTHATGVVYIEQTSDLRNAYCKIKNRRIAGRPPHGGIKSLPVKGWTFKVKKVVYSEPEHAADELMSVMDKAYPVLRSALGDMLLNTGPHNLERVDQIVRPGRPTVTTIFHEGQALSTVEAAKLISVPVATLRGKLWELRKKGTIHDVVKLRTLIDNLPKAHLPGEISKRRAAHEEWYQRALEKATDKVEGSCVGDRRANKISYNGQLVSYEKAAEMMKVATATVERTFRQWRKKGKIADGETVELKVLTEKLRTARSIGAIDRIFGDAA